MKALKSVCRHTDDVEEIIQSHLISGRPVERLQLA
jgi:(2Fe-2S) ferredoxin